tara:strand:+ start:553 stop:1131 length:579 start_codon:yes stop_codon:yes gene_type:complete
MQSPLKNIDPNDFNDKTLWEDFRNGDRKAFEKIYRIYFKDLFKYGVCILPDEQFVRDAIQELFIDLWKYKDRLSKSDQIKYYLLKSLRSKLYKILGQNKRRNLRAGLYSKEEIRTIPSHEDLIVESDQNNESGRQVKVFINELPERQREAIMLIFFNQKTYEETALIMSMSVQSVYTLIWRAFSTLRKKMRS